MRKTIDQASIWGLPTVLLLGLLMMTVAYGQPAGLVSRWTGDGNADDTVGGNNGTLVNGATYTQGVFGSGFLLDGVDDYLQAPTAGLPTGNTDRTFAMWVRIDGNVATESFFGGYGNIGSSFGHGYVLGSTGPLNTLFFSQWGAAVLGPNLQNGRWYHVAVTNVSSQVVLYLDGAVVNSGQLSIATDAASTFYLGRVPGTTGDTRRLQGAIDDVRVYNRALNGTEIQAIFNERLTPRPLFDFDGDGKTDLSIFRPNGAEWWWSNSSNGGNGAVQFGTPSDDLVPADYTGDGKTDIAFWRPETGNWFVLRSEDFSFYAFPFGAAGDVPVPADYDGDWKADAAVFRESSATWYINKSSGGTDIVGFGAAGDKPVNADYDGDGKADIAIYRPNGPGGAEWWVRRSSNTSVFALQFGTSTDKAVPGDFTGDGKADVAFWRPATGFWNVLRSEDFSYYAFPFGANGDIASPGDYDGDGKLDAAVFRPSSATWFANRSTAGTLIQQFGAADDVPVPSAFVR